MPYIVYFYLKGNFVGEVNYLASLFYFSKSVSVSFWDTLIRKISIYISEHLKCPRIKKKYIW